MVSNAVLNLTQWFEVLYSKKDKAHRTIEVMDLWDNVAWWAN
jgi:hypothetical protein